MGNPWSEPRTLFRVGATAWVFNALSSRTTVTQRCIAIVETRTSHWGLKKSILCFRWNSHHQARKTFFHSGSVNRLKENTVSSQLQGWRKESESFFQFLCSPAWILHCVPPFSREGAWRKPDCFEGICQYWKEAVMLFQLHVALGNQPATHKNPGDSGLHSHHQGHPEKDPVCQTSFSLWPID